MSNVPGPRMRDKPGDGKDRLAKLDQQIAEARKVDTPKPRGEKDKYAAMSMAWRITIELVVSIVIGAAMGWGLDALFGSLPIFLVVFTLLGFAAGIRTIMRTAEEEQRKNVAKKAADESNAVKPAKDESNAAKPAKDE